MGLGAQGLGEFRVKGLGFRAWESLGVGVRSLGLGKRNRKEKDM